MENYNGTMLLNAAMHLQVGEMFTVKYSTLKEARNAANGAGNKRLMEGLKNNLKIKRWTSGSNEYFITVTRLL